MRTRVTLKRVEEASTFQIQTPASPAALGDILAS